MHPFVRLMCVTMPTGVGAGGPRDNIDIGEVGRRAQGEVNAVIEARLQTVPEMSNIEFTLLAVTSEEFIAKARSLMMKRHVPRQIQLRLSGLVALFGPVRNGWKTGDLIIK